MFIDARELEQSKTLQTTLCIIGAGAAGISIAREFANSKIDIILVESGGIHLDPETQALYKGELTGQHYEALDVSRLRFFGGTTNHWGGNCRALHPIDFEHRPWVPHSGWPITREDLDPFYKRAIGVCELGPFDFTPEVWETDSAKVLKLSSGRVWTYINQFSPPTRFGTKYRSDIEDAKNIRTLLYANVTELETNEYNSMISGLKISILNGNKINIKAERYVLATGGIENARLLLASNNSMPNGVGNQNDLVGRFFMDHISINAGEFAPTSSVPELMDLYQWSARVKPQKTKDKVPHRAYVMLSDDVVRKEKIGSLSCIIDRQLLHSSHSSEGYLAMKQATELAKIRYFNKDFQSSVITAARNLDEVALGTYYKLFSKGQLLPAYDFLFQVEQTPNPDSRVTLGDDRDQLGMPRVKLDWRINDFDLQTIRRGLNIIATDLGSAGHGRVKTLLGQTNDELSTQLEWDWHHMGTTRMHNDPKQGVVDANCRVHGINNLFIAGSSVFPTGGHSVPTFTIVALALRLSDYLKEEFAS